LIRPTVAVFDLDGTLIDSDAALAAPFTALGIESERVPWGLPLADACARLGLAVEDYLTYYDPTMAQPFPGVDALLDTLDRWGIVSNKHPDSGPQELARLGWRPEASWFNAGAGPKRLGPVLEAMALDPSAVLFVGDTDHDEACARDAGCSFALAGWNMRAAAGNPDAVLDRPSDVLDLLAQGSGTVDP
jgi:phosphoglycolate phosphatase-like HAD superfamily hydrolase